MNVEAMINTFYIHDSASHKCAIILQAVDKALTFAHVRCDLYEIHVGPHYILFIV